jgi:alpha-D-ribose 1-methylphosphonate 5-triphosphate synthase subunit PhnH
VAYTLLDHEVSFAFVGQKIEIATQIYAATKARQVPVEEADYVIVEGNRSEGQILAAKCGNGAYPDRGATIIYMLDGEDEEASVSDAVLLQGPGIKHQSVPRLNSLSIEEFKHISHLNTEYPLGVDCIFLGKDNQVMCVPRSTKILFKV